MTSTRRSNVIQRAPDVGAGMGGIGPAPVRSFPLLRYFIFSSLVAIIAITIVVGFLVVRVAEAEFRSGIEDRGAREAVHFSALFFDSVWQPVTTANRSTRLEDIDRDLLEEFARQVAFGLDIVRITLRTVDDRVVFTTASDPTDVGTMPDVAVDRVARQGVPYAALSRKQTLVLPNGGSGELDLIVTYAPLRDVSLGGAREGRHVGTLEIAEDVTGDFAAARRDRIVTAIIGSSVTGLVLFVVLLSIVYRADRHLRRQQRDLALANLQAAQSGRLAAVGELISGVAHELNNPLSGIAGIARSLSDRKLDSAATQEVLMIQRETERSIRIVKSLLDFARPDAGQGMVPVSVNDAIGAALELRRHQLNMENITLVEDLDPGLPPVLGSAHELQQVILNLVVNAEQAMYKANRRGRLLIKSESLGDRVRIIVSDNGPGIPPESLDRLFDLFFTTKDVGEGTGLGLSISYRIVQKHSGRVWAESDPPHGATFFVELPSISSGGREENPGGVNTRRS